MYKIFLGLFTLFTQQQEISQTGIEYQLCNSREKICIGVIKGASPENKCEYYIMDTEKYIETREEDKGCKIFVMFSDTYSNQEIAKQKANRKIILLRAQQLLKKTNKDK